MIDNPWFIGIMGSVVASVIFTLLANLFSKKDYDLNVKKANSELINLLIMSTAEEKLPDKAVVVALINSIAKKYSVRINDIHSVNDTYDDLIRAIYETNFIPIDKKQVIANELSVLKIVAVVEEEKEKQRPPELFELRRTKLYMYLFFITNSMLFLGYMNERMGEFSWASFKALGYADVAVAGGITGLVISFILSRYLEYRIKKQRDKIANNTYRSTHQY